MMRAFIFLTFLLIGGLTFAQETVIQLKPSIRDDNTNKGLSGATIEVYKNGTLFASESSASSGKVAPIDLPVCIGCTYTVKIKKSGYVTKTAVVDGHSDYPEELPPGTVVQKFDVSIFESVEGIDFSFLDREPMIEFAIDSYGMLNYDQQKVKTMLKKIEDLKKEMEKKKEELEKEEAEKAKREADFNAYVAAGDAAVKKQEYEKAIGQYELALGIKADDQPTKNKLEDAKIKLEELRAKEQLDKDFSAKMAEAKSAYSADKLDEALKLYKEASAIKPNEQLPKNLIAEIEAELSKRANQEAAFNELVAAGDAAVGSEDFATGISKYEEALAMKKDGAVETKLKEAKNKLKAQEEALAKEKAEQEKYDQLLAAADAAFDTEKYDDAKAKYQEALSVKPGESKPTDRIAEIEKILKEKADELAAKEKLEADYQRAIEAGKEAMDQRKWDDALAKYKEALTLKANDSHALAQIDLINKAVEEEAADAKRNESYNAFMAEANALFDQKKYEEAKSKYNEAAGVKPEEDEPKNKIAEIERILADAEKAAELEAQYTALMSEGDALNDNKDYTSALDKYKKALDLKPGDTAAQGKIDAINALIDEQNRLAEEQEKYDNFVAKAEEAFNAKNYDEAKLNYNNALDIKDDAGIKAKIKEIDDIIAANQSAAELQAKYDAAIKEADDLYGQNDWPAALEKYKAALSIKEENYPKEKISELKEKIGKQEAAEAKEQAFNDLVAEAETAAGNQDYGAALAKYKEALAVKPDQSVSAKVAELTVLLEEQSQNEAKRAEYDAKIAEADQAFNDENWEGARALFQEAGRILPTETYPDEKIAEIEQRMADETAAETERNYQKIITKADGLFEDEKLDDAISYYQRALGLKPSDPYPQGQIDKINSMKSDKANAQAEAERLEKEYKALIAEGDEAFNAQNWTLALSKYKEALNRKPGEKYPEDRISELNTKLADADKQKAIDEQYNAIITEADQLFNSQAYQDAKKAYERALEVKAGEQYPKEQIAKADNFMRLETENEEEAAYQKLLSIAQEKLDAKNYDKALELYLRAKTTKPSDPLPQSRIDEINQIVAKLGEEEALRDKYDGFIKEADFQFEKGEWKKAKENYVKAFDLFNEAYPEKQIKECEKFMKEKTDAEVNKNYNKIIKKADEYFAKPNLAKAKELYERALTIKPSDQYPKDQLKEIEKLLNPSQVAQTKTNLTNYGNPNRGVNAVDIDAMLADAEEQRKFNEAQKAEQQRLDAASANDIRDDQQTDNNQRTKSEVDLIGLDIEKFETQADEERKLAVNSVETMEVHLQDTQSARGEGNENVVQLQNQVVDNIVTEIIEQDDENNLPREAYLADVDQIKSEISLESELTTTAQTNDVFEQREYVEDNVELRIENDPNRDIPRKNTEVYAEDHSIQLINASNESVWDQEDEVMQIKEETETEFDERAVLDIQRDLVRVEGVADLEDVSLETSDIDRVRKDDQYDVTIDQKKYTETVINDIEIENLSNDLPRQQMEDFTENQTVSNQEARTDRTSDQNNELFATNQVAEELEIEIVDNIREDDLKREGYETTVEQITENKDGFIGDRSLENENDAHETVNYLENNLNDRVDDASTADMKADESIDVTSDMVDEMKEENDELVAENTAEMENTEDYVESIRDIDLTEIDPEMQNELGSQFPEGVTEEIYTIEDENGLIVSYIVRRVVVRNGVGNVYEKVQTRYGTSSYTLNGTGITEYDWQDQTEAADLVRN